VMIMISPHVTPGIRANSGVSAGASECYHRSHLIEERCKRR
jgi:hypothetical protein